MYEIGKIGRLVLGRAGELNTGSIQICIKSVIDQLVKLHPSLTTDNIVFAAEYFAPGKTTESYPMTFVMDETKTIATWDIPSSYLNVAGEGEIHFYLKTTGTNGTMLKSFSIPTIIAESSVCGTTADTLPSAYQSWSSQIATAKQEATNAATRANTAAANAEAVKATVDAWWDGTSGARDQLNAKITEAGQAISNANAAASNANTKAGMASTAAGQTETLKNQINSWWTAAANTGHGKLAMEKATADANTAKDEANQAATDAYDAALMWTQKETGLKWQIEQKLAQVDEAKTNANNAKDTVLNWWNGNENGSKASLQAAQKAANDAADEATEASAFVDEILEAGQTVIESVASAQNAQTNAQTYAGNAATSASEAASSAMAASTLSSRAATAMSRAEIARTAAESAKTSIDSTVAAFNTDYSTKSGALAEAIEGANAVTEAWTEDGGYKDQIDEAVGTANRTAENVVGLLYSYDPAIDVTSTTPSTLPSNEYRALTENGLAIYPGKTNKMHLEKYDLASNEIVTGDMLKLVISRPAYGYAYQFQSRATVPLVTSVTTNGNLVAGPYIESGTMVVTVPAGATWLIVSCNGADALSTNVVQKVGAAEYPTKTEMETSVASAVSSSIGTLSSDTASNVTDDIPQLIYGKFDYSSTSDGSYIRDANNEKKSCVTCDFFKCDKNVTFTASGGFTVRVMMYDSNFSFVKLKGTTSTYKLTEGYYVKLQMSKTDGTAFGLGEARANITVTGNTKNTFASRENESNEHKVSPYDRSQAVWFGNPPTQYYRGGLASYTSPINAQTSSYETLGGDTGLYEHVVSAYNTLQVAHPNYITKNNLGVDSDGMTIWEYVFNPPACFYMSNIDCRPHPKLLIMTGTQGREQVPIISLYYFLKDMVENHKDGGILEYLHNHVEIHVIPMLSPWGVKAKRYWNKNLVSLNRNYDTSTWSYYHDDSDPSDNTGDAAGDQPENVIAQNWIKQNSDAVLFVDFHANTTSNLIPSKWYDVTWVTPMELSDSYTKRFYNAITSYIYELTGTFKQDYSLTTAASNPCSESDILGQITKTNTYASSKRYAQEHNVMSTTFECNAGFPCDADAKNARCIKSTTEMFGNFLRHFFLEYAKPAASSVGGGVQTVKTYVTNVGSLDIGSVSDWNSYAGGDD